MISTAVVAVSLAIKAKRDEISPWANSHMRREGLPIDAFKHPQGIRLIKVDRYLIYHLHIHFHLQVRKFLLSNCQNDFFEC